MLRSEVSSCIDDLSELSMSYPWIPDHNTVRPTPEVIQVKHETLDEIHEKWTSLEDFILFRIFGKPFSIENGKYIVKDRNINRDTKVFRCNDFPYDIPVGNHWVMWYGTKDRNLNSDQITNDINNALNNMVGHKSSYDFAWYVNPKMTVPEFFHVQVFWIELQQFH